MLSFVSVCVCVFVFLLYVRWILARDATAPSGYGVRYETDAVLIVVIVNVVGSCWRHGFLPLRVVGLLRPLLFF